MTEVLRLLSVTARQALNQASQAADRQASEGRVVERVRALLASRAAPGGPVLCAYFTTVMGDRLTFNSVFVVARQTNKIAKATYWLAPDCLPPQPSPSGCP
ncbi:hypothetical protein [Streptomyces chartreusis]|uniref:hypothetical protein n=1 Tax=Streptomyces chartreusis TaxID=1969 RepID=UPI0036C2A80E